jgi:hypothetical protein
MRGLSLQQKPATAITYACDISNEVPTLTDSSFKQAIDPQCVTSAAGYENVTDVQLLAYS